MSVSRRKFIKGICATGFLIQVPFYFSCAGEAKNHLILSNANQKIAQSIFSFIFPKKLAPGYNEINTFGHLIAILSDPEADPDENQFLINGFQWVNETAMESFTKNYNDLSIPEQFDVFRLIRKEDWGESWLSKMTTIVLEALLLDPIYGVNTNEAGWKWLQHQAGVPRPVFQNTYPHILERKKEHIIITDINQLYTSLQMKINRKK